MYTDAEKKEDDELLCTYLMMFGTDTLNDARTQDGEVLFLTLASQEGHSKGRAQNAWARITDAYQRRKWGELTAAQIVDMT